MPSGVTQERSPPLKPVNRKRLADRIVSAGLVVGVAHVALKFLGLVQAKAAAQYLETSQYETIYALTFTTIIYSLFLIGEEVIGPTLMPVFVRERDAGGEERAWDLANALLTVQTLLLVLVTAAVMLFPDQVIGLFTDWDRAADPTRYALMRESLQWLAPALICLSLGSTTYIILNSYKRFFLAAFGDSSWKICIVVALVGGHVLDLGYQALYIGLLAGSAAKLVTHLAGMLKELRFVRPSLKLNTPAVRAVLLLMLPLIAGILFAKVRDVYNIAVLTKIEEGGIIQSADLGKKLYASMAWLVPFTLQIALFPFLCELVDRDDREGVAEVLTRSCRLLLAVFIPGALVLAVLAQNFSVFFFLGGHTGLQVAVWTGVSTACYVLVLPAAAVERVLMQSYFAHRKMVSVSVFGIVCSSLSVGLSALFVVVLEVDALPALMAVALGFVVSRYLKSLILALYLKRSLPLFPARETLLFLGRLTVVAVLAGGTAWATLALCRRVRTDGIAASAAELWRYDHAKLQADTIAFDAAARRYTLTKATLITSRIDAKTDGQMTIDLDDTTAVVTWTDSEGKVQHVRVTNAHAANWTAWFMLDQLPAVVCATAETTDAGHAAGALQADDRVVHAGRVRLAGAVEGTFDDLTLASGTAEIDVAAAAEGTCSFTLAAADGQRPTVRHQPMPPVDRWLVLGYMFAAGVTAGLMILLASWLLRVDEPFEMLRWTWQKVAGRLGGQAG